VRLPGWLTGRSDIPSSFTERLAEAERVLGSAATSGDKHVVVTSHGLWVPEGDGHRRIGWHLVSTARWDGRALHVVEAVPDSEAGTVGRTVLLTDRPVLRLPLTSPGSVPETVQKRVTRSVLSSERREIPGGSALFVRRQVPGRDGVQQQVRPDPGTDVDAVRQALG
jgi:hypothetical protein